LTEIANFGSIFFGKKSLETLLYDVVSSIISFLFLFSPFFINFQRLFHYFLRLLNLLNRCFYIFLGMSLMPCKVESHTKKRDFGEQTCTILLIIFRIAESWFDIMSRWGWIILLFFLGLKLCEILWNWIVPTDVLILF